MSLDNITNEPIQPTKAALVECRIGGMNYHEIVNGEVRPIFHVQELRIYEDNCKFYFTGQLVIEAHLNTFEKYLVPQAEVRISFTAPPNSKIYTEVFKVYSFESRPREGDIQNSMVITISLIGKEYFRDKSEQVQQNFANVPATTAAQEIHQKYLSENGGLRLETSSIGMIGQQFHPHQVLSKQPSKAIHDLLDKAIFPTEHFGPGVYFRNKPGYVMGALEAILKGAPIKGNYTHFPAGGAEIETVLAGYDKVIHFRPMQPPGEDRGGSRGGELEDLKKVVGFIDLGDGNGGTGKGEGGTGFGSGVWKNLTDKLRQMPNVDKNGPGGFQSKENQFIAKLTYCPKYWVSVPLQTGINVTVGDRITVIYPVSEEIYTKTLWVARLIHELKFTEGKDRSPVTINGTTDMFGVWWNQ